MDYVRYLKAADLQRRVIFETFDKCTICPYYDSCQNEIWCRCKLKDGMKEGDKIVIILE